MRLFGFHILVKDLSFLMMYLLIMKYNLTNETFSPTVYQEFPGASSMAWGEILAATLMFSITPLVFGAFTYPLIYFGIKRLLGKTQFSLSLTGFFLTIVTPLVWLIGNGISSFDNKAKQLAWILCFALSMTTYWILNKGSIVRHVKTINQ